MGQSDASTPTRPDAAAIAAQNDAFRKLACLGIPPDLAIPGRLHVTRALIEAVYERADAEGAPAVYWLTQDFNHTARRLYDRVAVLTPFIRYSRDLG